MNPTRSVKFDAIGSVLLLLLRHNLRLLYQDYKDQMKVNNEGKTKQTSKHNKQVNNEGETKYEGKT